jgi:outer membrane protein assembly factor BamD (BamD/ComL family)
MRRISFLGIALLLLFLNQVYAESDSALYSEAIKLAKSGQRDIAFVRFSAILERHAGSEYTEEALFGAAEYYYSIGDRRDALKLLRQLVTNYPDSRARLFALGYLFKLSTERQKVDLARKLKKEIITFKQQSLLFRVFKNYQYRSPLNRLYKAVYYIDRTEFYVDGELFAKISF